MLKKVICASLAGAVIAMSGLTCLAGTIEYSNPSVENGKIIVNGNVKSGDAGVKKVNYVVIKENDNKGIYACEEVETDADGKFNFIVEFPTADDGATEGYTLSTGKYILRISAENCEIKEFPFDFVDTTQAIAALRECKNADDFNKTMTDMIDQLEFIGFEASLYNDKLSESEKGQVYDKISAECNLGSDKIEDILKVFNKHTLYRFINFGAVSALNKLDPSMEGKKFSEITDSSLKGVIETQIFKKSDYESNDDVNKECVKTYVIYQIRLGGTDKFDGLLDKYNTQIELSSTDYKKYTDLTETGKSYVRSDVLKDLRDKQSFDCEYFIQKLNDAVKNAPTNETTGGGTSGGKGGGTSISGRGSGSNSIIVEPDAQEPKDNDDTVLFSDISDFEWAKEAITELSERKIISGVGNGKFEPGLYVTREEIVKMILGLFEISPVNEEVGFEDADKAEWYFGYVSAANKLGIVNGVTESEFGVGSYVSRQDIAVMIKRAMDITKKYSIKPIKDNVEFTDSKNIAEYASTAVNELAQAGVINGFDDGSFKPNNNCTRAEAAKMLYGLIK